MYTLFAVVVASIAKFHGRAILDADTGDIVAVDCSADTVLV